MVLREGQVAMCQTGLPGALPCTKELGHGQKGGRGCSQEMGLNAWVIGSQPGRELHVPFVSMEPVCQAHIACQTPAAPPQPSTCPRSKSHLALSSLLLPPARRSAAQPRDGTRRGGLSGAHRHTHLRLLHLRELVAREHVKQHDWRIASEGSTFAKSPRFHFWSRVGRKFHPTWKNSEEPNQKCSFSRFPSFSARCVSPLPDPSITPRSGSGGGCAPFCEVGGAIFAEDGWRRRLRSGASARLGFRRPGLAAGRGGERPLTCVRSCHAGWSLPFAGGSVTECGALSRSQHVLDAPVLLSQAAGLWAGQGAMGRERGAEIICGIRPCAGARKHVCPCLLSV